MKRGEILTNEVEIPAKNAIKKKEKNLMKLQDASNKKGKEKISLKDEPIKTDYSIVEIRQYEKYDNCAVAESLYSGAKFFLTKLVNAAFDMKYDKVIDNLVYKNKGISDIFFKRKKESAAIDPDYNFRPINMIGYLDWIAIEHGFFEEYVAGTTEDTQYFYTTASSTYSYYPKADPSVYPELPNIQKPIELNILGYLWFDNNDNYLLKNKTQNPVDPENKVDPENGTLIGILHFMDAEERLEIEYKHFKAKKDNKDFFYHDLEYYSFDKYKQKIIKKVKTKMYLDRFLNTSNSDHTIKLNLMAQLLKLHLLDENLKDKASDGRIFTLTQTHSDPTVNFQNGAAADLSGIAGDNLPNIAELVAKDVLNVPYNHKLDKIDPITLFVKEEYGHIKTMISTILGIPIQLLFENPPVGLGTTGRGDLVNYTINIMKWARSNLDAGIISIIRRVTNNPNYAGEDFNTLEQFMKIFEDVTK